MELDGSFGEGTFTGVGAEGGWERVTETEASNWGSSKREAEVGSYAIDGGAGDGAGGCVDCYCSSEGGVDEDKERRYRNHGYISGNILNRE